MEHFLILVHRKSCGSSRPYSFSFREIVNSTNHVLSKAYSQIQVQIMEGKRVETSIPDSGNTSFGIESSLCPTTYALLVIGSFCFS